MHDEKIEVQDSGIRITELDVPRRDVADFLRDLSPAEREATVISALEVGVFCLERAHASQDLDFVRRQVQSLMHDVHVAFGKIPDETQKALTERIGTNEGQVLAPVKAIIDAASRVAEQRIGDVRRLLSDEIDPAKETTTLGRTLKALKDLLDPNLKNSLQASIDSSILAVTGDDGKLAATVKKVVEQAINPLVTRVDALSLEVRGQEAATEALAQTTAKGTTFEDETVERICPWASSLGHEIHHVGGDNRPGDILVKIAGGEGFGQPLQIVVECRDRGRGLGRKAVTDYLEAAMAERQANAAIYLSRDEAGLGKELGEWAEGSAGLGPWVACTQEHLVTALRFLLVQRRLGEMQASKPEVDSVAMTTQIQRIRTSLERVKTINSKVSSLETGATAIRTEAGALREEISQSLTEIEQAMRVSMAALREPADAA